MKPGSTEPKAFAGVGPTYSSGHAFTTGITYGDTGLFPKQDWNAGYVKSLHAFS